MVGVRLRVRIRLRVLLVSGYAHVFRVLSFVIVTISSLNHLTVFNKSY